ncbi:hypothetical protein [Flavobacterium sp. HNIBRBA15423]
MRTQDKHYKGQQKMNVISLERSFSINPSLDFVAGGSVQVHQYRQ